MALTKRDIEMMKGIFTTKQETEMLVDKMMMTFATREDLRHLGRTMQDNVKNLEMKMLDNFDSVMHELERIREDRIFAKGKDDEQDRRIGLLESRVPM